MLGRGLVSSLRDVLHEGTCSVRVAYVAEASLRQVQKLGALDGCL